MKKKVVIVAPLNWGLGHATRSIPIIQALINRGDEVILASDGRALHLLRAEFPGLKSVELPSYGVTYPQKHVKLSWLLNLRKLKQAINAENEMIDGLIEHFGASHIISDNRYGVFHPACRSIFITHQLKVPVPAVVNRVVNSYLHSLVNKFDICWIPDHFGPGSLAGPMTEGALRIPKFFIGPISRLKSCEPNPSRQVLVVLSGPEPDRSRLEAKLSLQLSGVKVPYKMVQGKTESFLENQANQKLHQAAVTTKELQDLFENSEIIVSRCGYSSLMDLYKTCKKAILIPTPHQPEQIVLARLHHHNKNFIIQQEDRLDLSRAVAILRQRKTGWSQIEFADPESLIRFV